MSDLIARSDAAKILSVSTRTLDRYVKKKLLKAHKRGAHTMFVRGDIEALLEVPAAQPRIDSAGTSSQQLSTESGHQLDGLVQIVSQMHQELEGKNQTIQALQYQIGQAEEQLKHSVPLLEATTEVEAREQEVGTLQRDLSWERRKNYVLVALLGLIIAGAGITASFFLTQG